MAVTEVHIDEQIAGHEEDHEAVTGCRASFSSLLSRDHPDHHLQECQNAHRLVQVASSA